MCRGWTKDKKYNGIFHCNYLPFVIKLLDCYIIFIASEWARVVHVYLFIYIYIAQQKLQAIYTFVFMIKSMCELSCNAYCCLNTWKKEKKNFLRLWAYKHTLGDVEVRPGVIGNQSCAAFIGFQHRPLNFCCCTSTYNILYEWNWVTSLVTLV